MYRGTKDFTLPTTVTGSLPLPSWYTENLGTRMFLDAMVSRRYREQYVDTLSCYLRDQELAGLDIVTDGDCRFDDDVGGQSWTGYPPHHMSGYERGADAGRERRCLVPEGAYSARLSRGARHAGNRRSNRAGRSAIHCNTLHCGKLHSG
jgi:hypothetical protein